MAALKARILNRFPARVQGGDGISIASSGGVFTFAMTYASLTATGSLASGSYIAAQDASGSFARITLASLTANITGLLDSTLLAIASLTPTSNSGIYWSGTDVAATYSLTGSGRALGGVTGAADRVPYFTNTTAADVATLTAAGRTQLALSDYPSASTDNTLPRFHGGSGSIQTSGVVVDDSNNVSANSFAATTAIAAGATVTAPTLRAGSNAATQGTVSIFGATSGSVNIGVPANFTGWNFNMPTTAGTAGQPLVSQGGGTASMKWGTLQYGISPATLSDNSVLRANISTHGYNSARYHGGQCMQHNTTTSATLASNTMYFAPFINGDTTTFTRIGIDVMGTGSAASARLGVFNWANGVPSSLITDFGTVSVASTGAKEITISQSLPTGLFGLGIVLDGTVSVRGSTNYSVVGLNIIGFAAPGSGIENVIATTHVFGSLPSSVATVTISSGSVYYPWLRNA